VRRYDLVLGILWKRIGTPLNPAKFSAEDPSHASGTVYELETTFAAAERSGAPDVVVGLALRTPPRHWYQATPARAELVSLRRRAVAG
jgi:hypothetical protein